MSQTVIEALNAVVPIANARTLDATAGRYPRTLVGLLLADSALAQRTARFAVPVQEGMETDYKLRFDLEALRTRGLDRRNPTWGGTQIDPQAATHPVEGRFIMSGYADSLAIYKHETELLTKQGAPFSDFVQRQAMKIVDSKHKALQDDLLGADGVVQADRSGLVTADWTVWGANGSRLGNIAYPLQSGYTGNASTGTGTFYYGDNFDLNVLGDRVKAVTSGNSSTGFGSPTPSAIRQKLLMPLADKDKGNASPESTLYMLVDSAVYDYLMTFVEDQTLVTNFKGAASFGYNDVAEIVGVRFVREPYLDTLYSVASKRVMIGIDPTSWVLRHKDLMKIHSFPGDGMYDRALVEMLWRWDFAIQLICEQPWRNCYAYDVTLTG